MTDRGLLGSISSSSPEDEDNSFYLYDLIRRGKLFKVKKIIGTLLKQNNFAISVVRPLAHIAVYQKNLELTQYILDLGNHVSDFDVNGLSLLHVAALKNSLDIVNLLLHKGSNVNSCTSYMPSNPPLIENFHLTPLSIDQCNCYIQIRMCKHPIKVIPGGMAPLHFAILSKNVKTVESLLWRNADVNARACYNVTPLHVAIASGSVAIVILLLQYGADVNAQFSYRHSKKLISALDLAIVRHQSEIVKYLVGYSANVDIDTPQGLQSITYAFQTRVELPLIKEVQMCHVYTTIGHLDLNRPNSKVPLLNLVSQSESEYIICTKKLCKFNVNEEKRNRKILYDRQQLLVYILLEAIKRSCKTVVADILRYRLTVETSKVHEVIHFSLFYRAITSGQVETVRLLLDYGFDPNHCGPKGKPAIYHAVDLKDPSIFNLFIERNVNTNIGKHELILINRAMIRNKEMFDTLMNLKPNFSVDAIDENKRTLLHVAVYYNKIDLAKKFIEMGCNVNAIDGFRKTPICYAVRNGSTEMVKLLIKQGAFVYDEMNLLHIAVFMENYKMIKCLLRCTNVLRIINAGDRHGNTALHYVSKHKKSIDSKKRPKKRMTRFKIIKKDIIHRLLSSGACIDAENKRFETPLHLAVLNGDENVAKTLCRSKANPNTRTKYYRVTPLHEAVKSCMYMTKLLLMHGSNANAEDSNKKTPLHHACAINEPDLVQLLLIYRANVNVRDICGRTPLHYATKNGGTDCFKCLINRGADFNITCHKGETPFYGIRSDFCNHFRAMFLLTVSMMKALKRYVGNKNELWFKKIHSRDLDFIHRSSVMCEHELESLKMKKLTGEISFYDVLTRNVRQTAIYRIPRCETKLRDIRQLEAEFPVYGHMIWWEYKIQQERYWLESKCDRFFQLIFTDRSVPEVHTKILRHLSTDDLISIIKACSKEQPDIPRKYDDTRIPSHIAF